MAHEVETMAYAGETPWHGLGTKVNNDLTPAQIRKAAGLSWDVERKPMYYRWGDENEEIPVGSDVLVRNDTGRKLTEISEEWQEVSNQTAFEFFDEFIKAGQMEMHTAGSLKNGNIVWALAKVRKHFQLFNKKDTVESFLLFSLPHIYGKCLDVRFTPIRVVCNNTLTLALDRHGDMAVKLNHRRKFDADQVKETLGLADNKLEIYKKNAQLLSTKKWQTATLEKYFSEVFPNKSAKEDSEDKMSRPARKALEVMDTQPGADLGAGTWWQAFNAVTYLTDHQLGHSPDTRLYSAWYGSNRKKKVFALEKAVEYANAA